MNVAVVGMQLGDQQFENDFKSCLIAVFDGSKWYPIGKLYKGLPAEFKKEILNEERSEKQPENYVGGETEIWFKKPCHFMTIKFKSFKNILKYQL